MSVGNVTQAVTFDHAGLTLVLGNNMDLGGDGSRNGTGKTTIINALSYALYGNALYNIRKDNLVNKTNNKQMMVTVDFEKDGIEYKIERGRKPNVFRFMVNNTDQANTDEMQGEGRESQAVIEQILGMSHNMFKHVVALNTYTEPFLSMRANDQKDMIEQLLGITQLSEKAELLKERVRNTRDAIQKKHTVSVLMKKQMTRIANSIKDMERRQKVWADKKSMISADLQTDLLTLQQVNIDKEIQAHSEFEEFNNKRTQIETLNGEIARLTTSIEREQKRKDKAQKDLDTTLDHKCYACGQEIHDEQHEKMVAQKTELVEEFVRHLASESEMLNDYKSALDELGELGNAPTLHYNTLSEVYEHQNKLSALESSIQEKENTDDPYEDQIQSLKETGLQDIDWTEVNRLTELKDHQDFLLKLLTSKDSFIRRRIIEQNLQFLNTRLEYYITRLGLPHEVQFQSDLTVSIVQLGQDLDFDNLSRGERNRLILGLSWAFRDVFESMNHPLILYVLTN